MKNLGQMMKQAQEMQQRMQEMQTELERREAHGAAAAGMVKAVVTGKGVLRSLDIDRTLVDPDDKEVLEDLVVAAVNDAREKADEMMRAETQKLMGGLQLPPGMKLPF